MKQQGRLAYWLHDAGAVDNIHFKGEISIASYGVTLYAGGISSTNGPDDVDDYTTEATTIIPWQHVMWIEVGT